MEVISVIDRYSRPVMGEVWSEEAKYQRWLDVELAACEAWNKLGRIPDRALAAIKKKAAFSVRRIDTIEKTVKHDVISFLTSVAEKVGPDSRFIHIGLTSSDVVDTAYGMALRDSADIIIDDLQVLLKVFKKKARSHKMTMMMGRSHGIHAEPTTFGLKMAVAYDEFSRNLDRMKRARDVIAVGKMSGAVGTFANIDPFVERYSLKKLGLKAEPAATQVVHRDRHAEFFATLAVIASSVERVAVEIRHLQRSEVLEVEEAFTKGQKGSSAMPHKKNPILSENLTGLARLVRGYSDSAMENVALWHERDISHSSVERIIGPDSTTLVDFMLVRMTGMIENLVVHKKNMRTNMDKLRGLLFSQKVLLKLTASGMTREEAYEIVQTNAMAVWEGGTGGGAGGDDFLARLLKDKGVTARLGEKELKECFDFKPYLKHVDYIFKRVFGR